MTFRTLLAVALALGLSHPASAQDQIGATVSGSFAFITADGDSQLIRFHEAGGTLGITADAALGAPATPVTIRGGVLHAETSMTIARGVVFDTAGSVRVNDVWWSQ